MFERFRNRNETKEQRGESGEAWRGVSELEDKKEFVETGEKVDEKRKLLDPEVCRGERFVPNILEYLGVDEKLAENPQVEKTISLVLHGLKYQGGGEMPNYFEKSTEEEIDAVVEGVLNNKAMTAEEAIFVKRGLGNESPLKIVHGMSVEENGDIKLTTVHACGVHISDRASDNEFSETIISENITGNVSIKSRTRELDSGMVKEETETIREGTYNSDGIMVERKWENSEQKTTEERCEEFPFVLKRVTESKTQPPMLMESRYILISPEHMVDMAASVYKDGEAVFFSNIEEVEEYCKEHKEELKKVFEQGLAVDENRAHDYEDKVNRGLKKMWARAEVLQVSNMTKREKERMDKEKEEEQKMLKEMLDKMGVWRGNKKRTIEGQRRQEIVEGKFNKRLTSLEDIEATAETGGLGVEKRMVEYEGGNIPVYDLKGMPFAMLTHAVDYRAVSDPGTIGTVTSERIMKDPSVWAETQEETRVNEGYGTRDANARGNVISTSYINSEHNKDTRYKGGLVYGFNSVEAGSLLEIRNEDAGSTNLWGDNYESDAQINGLQVDDIEYLEGPEQKISYNEVLIRRYDEDGNPKLPDFIVVENGEISEEALRHAKYFNIPILNIEQSEYDRKMLERGQNIINSISENDGYEKINEKLCELESMSKFRGEIRYWENIGRGEDGPSVHSDDIERFGIDREKADEIAKIEFEKRIDFIEEVLKMRAKSTKEDFEAFEKSKGLENFRVTMEDVQNKKERLNDGDEKNNNALDGYSKIYIGFSLGGREIETRVHDGENPVFERSTEDSRNDGSFVLENVDSSVYNHLMPLIDAYFEAQKSSR